MTIDILMATYNGATPVPGKPGATFLSEQIDSLLQQTNQDWRLIIRDDGSQDGTLDVIKKYRAEHPGKILVMEEDTLHVGVRIAFARLMEYFKDKSTSDYAMFCDQDDIWHADKIEKSLSVLKEMESRSGKETPLLVHTDSEIANRAGKIVMHSFKKSLRESPDKRNFREELSKPCVQGCTILANRALMEAALPVPYGAAHDTWTGLVAYATGERAWLDEPTMRYRQHGHNTEGERHSLTFSTIIDKFNKVMDRRIINAAALKKQLYQRMPEDKQAILDEFLTIAHYPQPKRALSWLRHGFTLSGPPEQNLALLGGHTYKGEQSR